jgi:hypothetical protein
MGTIQDMVKKAANKISDEVNKNKWDHNSINSALFMKDSDNVPPNPSAAKPAFQQAGAAAPVPANNTAPAPTPATSAAPALAQAATGAVSVAAQGSINTPTETPAASSPAPAPQPAPVQNGYVKPVFRSRFAGPVKTTQQSNSLATLPTVDPSQKISNIGTEAAATPAPAADSVPASAPAPGQAAPAQAIPAQPVPMQAAPVQTAAAQAAPVQATPIQAAPVQTMPGQPNPVLGAATPAAQPAVSTPAQTVAPVAPVTEYCYYVQIKHTKTFPAPGSVVLMRSCDHEYVWTNEKSEAEKVSYSTCPHCGKPVSNTSVEMD